MTKESIFQYLKKATGWALLFLFITELFLRIFIMSIPSNAAIQNGGGIEIRGQEGYGILYYLPNREIASTHNDAGAKNIIVLGDSFTHAPHVMFWNNFTSIAESTLYNQGITSCNLRNFGRRRLDLAHYLGMGPSIIEFYHPAAIVMQVAPTDLVDAGFRYKDNGFYFKELPDGKIVLHEGTDYKDFLKVQQTETPSLAFSSLFDFSKTSIQYAIEQQNEIFFPNNSTSQDQVQNPVVTTSDARVARIENLIKLTETIYKDIPIIFVLIPEPSNLTYKQGQGLLQLKTLLEKNPNWSVTYPFDKFLQSVNQGYPPHGFGNTIPMSGHINSTGHYIIGEKLAENLLALSLCEK